MIWRRFMFRFKGERIWEAMWWRLRPLSLSLSLSLTVWFSRAYCVWKFLSLSLSLIIKCMTVVLLGPKTSLDAVSSEFKATLSLTCCWWWAGVHSLLLRDLVLRHTCVQGVHRREHIHPVLQHWSEDEAVLYFKKYIFHNFQFYENPKTNK